MITPIILVRLKTISLTATTFFRLELFKDRNVVISLVSEITDRNAVDEANEFNTIAFFTNYKKKREEIKQLQQS